ncbi:hypothetical protein OG393_31020 [Streptomyces sp. NBC_01216]|uniref:hypothetical protein n=1 Tax=Streptomyces sp. NBC_01216 TaxID=2903778 RepID=UPI002E11ABB1|nr:hypothetical protein OG393_31020 [Streptomyces sp. NBC_01216]
MRVRVSENIKIFHGHRSVRLAAGQEVTGELAALLLERAPGKVTDLTPAHGPAEGTGPDGGGPEGPEGLDIEASVAAVVGWVGDDPERAAEALAAEQAKDSPRSTLVKQLTAVVGEA